MDYNMKLGIIGLVHLLILITLLFSGSSPVASSYMETDDSSRKAVEVPAEESLFAANGVSVKFLFVIEGFSVEQKFATPMGVFYDNYHNEIYIADTGNDQVAVFDAGGQPRFQIRSVHGLKAPLDLVVNSENQIYVSQMEKSYLQLFDFRGRHLENLSALNAAPFKPGRICLDAEDKLYVVDRERAQILVYDEEGNFQFQFGGKGEGEGKLRLISGIDVDSTGRIYVADSKQRPIQAFDRNGKFLFSFGSHGPREEEFSFPGGISIDEKNRIWIVDTFRHQVKVFRTDGGFLFQFGIFGTKAGQFFFPIDLALDEQGKIYVLEKGANRLQVFEIQE
jgi:DNA-binding beta-propeller fold protein YncE